MTKRSWREDQSILSPVGKEPVQKTGNFCLSKTPTGDYYSRLKKYAYQMQNYPTPTEKLLFDFLTDKKIKFQSQKVILLSNRRKK